MNRYFLYFFGYLLFIPLSTLSAQSYDASLGLRLGTDWGLTGKYRIADRVTVEGILQSSLQREETNITLLVEKHNPVIIKRLNLYYGAGLHKGWADQNNVDVTYDDPFGVSVIGGVEFTIARINLSYDIKPAINISGGEKRFYTQSGISLRYVLQKRKLIEKRSEAEKARDKKRRQKRKERKKNGGNWKIWEKF